MEMQNRNRWLILVTVLLCFAGVGLAPASAQAQPIAIGENKTSEVTEAAPIAAGAYGLPDGA